MLSRGLLIRIFLSIGGFGMMLYMYLNEQNQVVRLRMRIPALMEEIHTLKENNVRLRYEIDSFESPMHLIKLAQKSEYSHLKHPFAKEVVSLVEGKDLQSPDSTVRAGSKDKGPQVLLGAQGSF